MGNETVQVDNRVDLAMVYAETGRSKEALAMQRDAIRLYTRAGAWQQAHDAALSTFRALVSLGERRAACLLAGYKRHAASSDAWNEYLVPAELLGLLGDELGQEELRRLMDRGVTISVPSLVAEVLRAIDELLA